MLTIQILTKNNQNTIRSTLESISNLNPNIIVGDLGSSDNTLAICKEFNTRIVNVRDLDRNIARNKLTNTQSMNLWMEPWEMLIGGHKQILDFRGKAAYIPLLQNKTLVKELRLWHGHGEFVNPVFEYMNIQNGSNLDAQLFSTGSNLTFDEIDDSITRWKGKEPLSSRPYYYHACILFSQKRYDEFLNMANQYLFMDKEQNQSTIMLRYYYAMVHLIHKKEVKSTLQNINLCLCSKPLMAEFWCLMGDVYYQLLHRFDHAKEFYENAIFMGSKRLKSDRMPMDIEKYNQYPSKMIQSCNEILSAIASKLTSL